MDLQKVVAMVGAAVYGVALAFGVDVSPIIAAVGAAVVIVTPIVVYAVRQGQLPDAPLANKAIIAVGPAIVALADLAGVSVSEQVEQVTGAAIALTPLLVFFESNFKITIPPPEIADAG